MRALALRMAVALVLLVALVVQTGGAPTGAPESSSGRIAATPAPDGRDPVTPTRTLPDAGAASPLATDDAAGDTQTPDAPTVSALEPGAVNRTSIALSATYNVWAYLGFGSRTLNVNSRMVVTNRSGVSIDRIELNTIALRLGGLRMRVATVDGRAVRVTRADQTLVVPLGGILPAGQSVAVQIAYGATLRSSLSGSNWMFTRVNGIANAYRWLPWISRQRPFNRPNHGDPFITPVSPEVRVNIRADRYLVFATSGTRIGYDGRTWRFLARNVRDFTLTASPDYRTRSVAIGDTTVRVFYRPGAASGAMLSAGRQAIARMEALVGPYPYRDFKVVQSAGSYGMESPGLIWIPTGAGNLSYLIHHETAHQWFYSLVGNDQAYEPFTDEAAADFLARYTLGLRRASRCSIARLDMSIYRYGSVCYYEIIYIQGGNFLDDLRRRMGGTPFWRGMRAYIAAHRWGLAPTKSLLDTLDAQTPLNLVPRFAPRFPRLY